MFDFGRLMFRGKVFDKEINELIKIKNSDNSKIDFFMNI
jgi:hypothetical protein